MIDASDEPLAHLGPRDASSHKGDFGRGLVVGGSRGMAGAPAMAGMACLRSGAGLVTVATPRCVQSIVAGFCPAYTTNDLADDGERLAPAASPAITDAAESASAIAVGPGLGRSAGVDAVVNHLNERIAEPMVVDADGLNGLAAAPGSLARSAGPRVLTPHAGEFARLAGEPLRNPNDDGERRDRAAELAASGSVGLVVLLKGPRTVVTDGRRFAINATGNPGMASGGSGDVLTGVVLALLCQGLAPFDAARLGAHVHGLAGDLAAAKLGETALMATDLIDWLPVAWRELAGGA